MGSSHLKNSITYFTSYSNNKKDKKKTLISNNEVWEENMCSGTNNPPSFNIPYKPIIFYGKVKNLVCFFVLLRILRHLRGPALKKALAVYWHKRLLHFPHDASWTSMMVPDPHFCFPIHFPIFSRHVPDQGQIILDFCSPLQSKRDHTPLEKIDCTKSSRKEEAQLRWDLRAFWEKNPNSFFRSFLLFRCFLSQLLHYYLSISSSYVMCMHCCHLLSIKHYSALYL